MISSVSLLLLVLGIVALSAFIHGVTGFGFPLFSTAMIALIWDVKTAIIMIVFPGLLVNVICILRGGIRSPALKKYWIMPIYMILGTVLGTQALLHLNQDLLSLILASMIFVFFTEERYKESERLHIIVHHKLAPPILGIGSGILAGAVGAAPVALIIYFSTLQLSAIAMTQALNLCFVGTRVAQIGTLGLAGSFAEIPTRLFVLLPIISTITLLLGFRLQRSFSDQTYRKIVKIFLLLIGVMLVLRVAWHQFS